MRNFKKRKGVALIYTVLVSALVLMSIVALTFRIVPENMITSARSHSQKALSVAEAGASQILFDLRSFGDNSFSPASGHFLEESEITSLIDGNDITILDREAGSLPTNPEDAGFKTSYDVKINVLDNDEENDILDVNLYVCGVVSDKNTDKVLARSVIKTNFKIKYEIEVVPVFDTVTDYFWHEYPPSNVFDYAMYSGGDIEFGGSAQTVEGNIHAEGIIDLGTAKNQVRVGGGGDAEARGNIIGKGIITGEALPNSPSVPFPELNLDAYRQLADAFKSGQAPYDGSNANYPDLSSPLSSPLLLPAVQSYLGDPSTPTTLEGINNFYNDLKNKTGAFAGVPLSAWQQLLNKANAIVYYIQGDVHINGQFECIGTLVIDGNLMINGNSQVGDPLDPGAAAILVSGDIELSNGTADLYGLFYTEGKITGSGTFYCEGTIVSKESISVKGNYTVKYHEITNPNLNPSEPGYWEEVSTEVPIGEITYYSVVSAAGFGSNMSDMATEGYKWIEVSYDDFLSA